MAKAWREVEEELDSLLHRNSKNDSILDQLSDSEVRHSLG